MLLHQSGRAPIAWKSRELDEPGDARGAYIRALRSADGHDYQPLFRLFLEDRGRS
jgi:hypothetical protein